MDWLNGIQSLLAAILGAGLGSWMLKMYQARVTAQRTDRTDVWHRQSQLLDKVDSQLRESNEQVQRGFEAESRCRRQVERLFALGQWQNELLKQHHATLVRAGLATDPLPDFPDFKMDPPLTDEFTTRSVQHATGLLHAEVEATKKRMPDQGESHRDPAGGR
jgi:hypothetical protein